MKKILHLITSLEGGGTENFLHQILANSPPGFAHEVMYFKKDGVIGERIRALGLPVRRAEGLFDLFQTFRRTQPDILHTCLYRAHILGRILGRMAGLRTVVTSQRALDIGQKPWQRAIDRATLPLSTVVLVNSHAAAEMIARQRGAASVPEILEIPNGINPAVFKPADRAASRQRLGLPADAVVGGTLMRLHSEKGADLIPLYAAALLGSAPSVHLAVAGVGPLSDRLKQQLASAEYRDRVHWLGWHDNVPEFLSSCDFFWSLSREESFPQTLVEASAMGVPWVAPDTGGVGELAQNGAIGRLFRRLDIADAARQSAAIISELPRLTTEAHAAAPQIQDRYALDKMVARVYQVFSRC
jgi:glycosyltransferase involved in cell wall biosynthesis